MKLFCDQCGNITKALYDGYAIGDRVLEGVMFEVEVVGNKLLTKDVVASAKDYFSDLNEAKWLKEANLSLEDELTEGGEGLNCPENSRHFVVIVNDDGSDFTPMPKAPSKKVKVFKGVTKLEDFIKE